MGLMHVQYRYEVVQSDEVHLDEVVHLDETAYLGFRWSCAVR